MITDSTGRDFESLGFGWLTVNRSLGLPAGVNEDLRKDFYLDRYGVAVSLFLLQNPPWREGGV